ncbi:hypothetical protein EVAR_25869_1 [Eumeta japonica]|uniref:Uncharacterized protein n=1 Tax=Eumeta variegata TaxID=151549 RepID=A0A4C1X4Y3_EUMVA|nr:hypothetical protein EVAR_25869_1 [Eumeta japonica]
MSGIPYIYNGQCYINARRRGALFNIVTYRPNGPTTKHLIGTPPIELGFHEFTHFIEYTDFHEICCEYYPIASNNTQYRDTNRGAGPIFTNAVTEIIVTLEKKSIQRPRTAIVWGALRDGAGEDGVYTAPEPNEPQGRNNSRERHNFYFAYASNCAVLELVVSGFKHPGAEAHEVVRNASIGSFNTPDTLVHVTSCTVLKMCVNGMAKYPGRYVTDLLKYTRNSFVTGLTTYLSDLHNNKFRTK